MKRKLHIDFETRSVVDLRKSGVYVYAAHPSTDVLLACWAIDDRPVRTWFAPKFVGGQGMVGVAIQSELREALVDSETIVCAHNAGFERLMFEHILGPRYGWPIPQLHQWDCTAARAARQALPRSLDGAAQAIGLDVEKDKAGYRLMLQVSKPRDFDEQTGEPIWWNDVDKFRRLAQYCAQDVEVERELDKKLRELSPFLRQVWQLTEKVNDRGVAVDVDFVDDAIERSETIRKVSDMVVNDATNGAVRSATNVPALKTWLAQQDIDLLDTDDPSLAKANVQALLTRDDLPPNVRTVLQERLEAGKTSVKKLQAMKLRSSEDFRVRGNFVFHGASTGRYAGAGIQPQNFPRKVVKDWHEARANLEALSMDDLSGMLRGTIHAKEGHTLMWADYAAIEARGIAWLAGAQELVDQFASGGKVYETMGGLIFKIPVEEVKKDSVERHLGKTVILGAGYGMGPAKFKLTCEAQGTPVDLDLAERAIYAYRDTYPEIPRFWYALQNAAMTATLKKGREVKVNDRVSFCRDGDWLLCKLPSERLLFYKNPRVEDDHYNRPRLVYDAVNSVTKHWGPESTWGGKLAENVTQATCADLIMGAMLRLEHNSFPVVLTVHDEVVCEVPKDRADERKMLELMCEVPDWATGFPIAAEAKTNERYGK